MFFKHCIQSSKAVYRQLFLLVSIVGLFGILCPNTMMAQTELSRVSAVERSDGKGFVIRYHLSEPIDSATVIQPSADLIQMAIYSSEIDTTNFQFPPSGPVFESFDLYKISGGIALNIHLQDGNYFNYNTYTDRNGTDYLLALTSTTSSSMTGITSDMDPINWALFSQKSSTAFDDTSAGETSIEQGDRIDVVVIDAGHGGKDPGTSGGRIREKDVVLDVALKVGEYIKEHIPDLEVVYTRTDDTFISLEDRGRIANENNGDLFISIHANAFDHHNKARKQSVYGAEVFFLGMARSQTALEVMKRENSVIEFESGDVEELTEEDLLIYELMNAGNMSTSQRIAEIIEQQFRERAQRKSRGVKQAGFQVLYEASMPGVLIELGFLSNPNEANYLTSEYGQSIVASAIFRSIRDFKEDYDKSFNRETTTR
jgi:N-acetylmuramoyl-L-alanine amidase